MRLMITALGYIEYPEEIAFAFNPNRVKVATSEDVTFTIGGKYADTRSAHDGKVEIDISKYLQCFVDKDVRKETVTVTCKSSAGTASFSLLVIWGVLNVGETWNASRTVTWWKGLPFSFGMYIPDGVTVQTRYDGNGYVDADLGSGIVYVDPSDVWPDATEKAVIRMDSEAGGVFDFTFDGSFGSVKAEVINRINVCECTDGIYLRWIDRHGWRQYHLFDEGDLTQTDKAMDKVTDVHEASYHYNADVYQGKEVEKTVKLGAPLVDVDTFEKLMTLATSPVVELYAGDDVWIPVNIAPLTITKGSKPLNDMEFVMYYPEVMTQRL